MSYLLIWSSCASLKENVANKSKANKINKAIEPKISFYNLGSLPLFSQIMSVGSGHSVKITFSSAILRALLGYRISFLASSVSKVTKAESGSINVSSFAFYRRKTSISELIFAI